MTLLSLALATQALAAVLAILIARRRRAYVPAAVALTLIAAINVLERLVAPALAGASVPYHGLPRVVFHCPTLGGLKPSPSGDGFSTVV